MFYSSKHHEHYSSKKAISCYCIKFLFLAAYTCSTKHLTYNSIVTYGVIGNAGSCDSRTYTATVWTGYFQLHTLVHQYIIIVHLSSENKINIKIGLLTHFTSPIPAEGNEECKSNFLYLTKTYNKLIQIHGMRFYRIPVQGNGECNFLYLASMTF